MTISDTVAGLVGILMEFSGGKLKNERALSMLLQHANDTARHEAVGTLAFQGAALTRVLRTIRAQTSESEHYPLLEEEFSRSLHEFRAMLEQLVADAPEELAQFASRHYLPVSEASLSHLLDAANDFSWLKNWELAVNEEQREG